MRNGSDIVSHCYPEMRIGGYAHCDPAIEFYLRIRSICCKKSKILDLGAGRASWNDGSFASSIRNLQGDVELLIAADVDPAVLENSACDKSVVIDLRRFRLPFDDHFFDVVICDFVFEHVEEPDSFAKELSRVLRPEGFVCARTPPKYGYIPMLIQLIPNRYHKGLGPKAEPGRKAEDMFPTVYRLNTFSQLRKYFPSQQFENLSYRFCGVPAYHFGSKLLLNLMRFLNWVLPPMFKGSLFIFLRKRS